MAQVDNIVKGWKAYLFGDHGQTAKERAKLCKKCPSAVSGTYEKIMPDFQIKEIQGLKCKQCGCPLSTKLRSEKESCPLKKW